MLCLCQLYVCVFVSVCCVDFHTTDTHTPQALVKKLVGAEALTSALHHMQVLGIFLPPPSLSVSVSVSPSLALSLSPLCV